MTLTVSKIITKNIIINTNKELHSTNDCFNAQPTVRKKFCVDPAYALEPLRKKLTRFEAQRIIGVFDETVQKINTIIILPNLLHSIDKYNASMGNELVELLTQHSISVSVYEDICKEIDKKLDIEPTVSKSVISYEKSVDCDVSIDKHNVSGSVDLYESDRIKNQDRTSFSAELSHNSSSQLDMLLQNMKYVAQEISHSTKNILRAFAFNPTSIKLITGEICHCNPQCSILIENLQCLREILMHMLLTKPDEERERIACLTDVSKQDRQNAAIIDKLELELIAKNSDKNEEVRKKNDIIKHLQADLHQIDRCSKENISHLRQEAEKQEVTDEKNSVVKCQKLQLDSSQMRLQLQSDITQHRETEYEFRRRYIMSQKKYKVETEVENWIQRYDQEIGERQDEYEEIDAIYTEEKNQLHELEEHFEVLEKEYVCIMEERQLARERQEKSEREMAMAVKAVTTIQAVWRSYKVRKALKQRKKKKGGKK